MIELAPQTIDKIQSMFQKDEKKEGNHHPQNPDEILKNACLRAGVFSCNHYVIKHMKL